MKKLITVVMAVFAVVCLSVVAFAGGSHTDGKNIMQFFAPVRNAPVTHTKADKTYTPTSGTKLVMIQPTAAVTMKINGTGTAYPIAANAEFGPIGIANRSGAGVTVSSLVFGGASSATKTIHILEQ